MIRQLCLIALLLLQGLPQAGNTISGQLLFPDGSPAKGVRISALDVVNSTNALSILAGFAETDDSGRYRIVDLPAGRYYVVAGQITAPTYFPGTASQTEARIVELSAGSRLDSVNFSVVAPLTLPRITANVNNNNNRNSNTGGVPPGGPRSCGRENSPATGGLALAADRAGGVYFATGSMIQKIAPDGGITLIAGNGLVVGSRGDGGPAKSATLGVVVAIATDGAGNLFLAESPEPRVRKISPDGIITTVAGNGTTGVSPDGASAISAPLCPLTGLAVDGLGNVFIASGPGTGIDSFIDGDYRVRKIDRNGIIASVMGSGAPGRLPGPLPDGGQATAVSVFVRGITADASGNLYAIDFNGVRKVAPSGVLTTITGSPGANENIATVDGAPISPGYAVGLAVDNNGSVFFSDGRAGRVLKIQPGVALSSIAGNGTKTLSGEGVPAATSSLSLDSGLPNNPFRNSIAVDGAGNVFVGEYNIDPIGRTRRIRKIAPDGTMTTAFSARDVYAFKVSGQILSAIPEENAVSNPIPGFSLPESAPPAMIYVVSKTTANTRAIITRVAMDAPNNGRFELDPLRPGSYEVFAALPDIHGWGVASRGEDFQPLAFGRTTINVTGNDLANVSVTVRPGMNVQGRVTLDGRPAAPEKVKIRLQTESAAAIIPMFQTIDRFSPTIAGDGLFVFPGLPAGAYGISVEVDPESNMTVVDMLLDGKSIRQTGITVGATPIGGLEIVLRTNR